MWDLPQELIYVDIEDKFRQNVINKAREITKNNLTKLLKTSKENLYQWKIGRSKWKGKIKRRFVPLREFLRLCSLIKDPEFSKENLEKHILAFRGPGNGKIIKTKFPWYEDERIIRILAHLLGDGHGVEFNNRDLGLPYYRNTRENLREEFKKDLQFFGDVHTNLNIDMLQFPRVISYIISHIYGIEFGTYKGEIPKILYKFPRKIVAQFIRALFDDEANVDDSRIKFTSFNKQKIFQIRELITKKFPEIKDYVGEIVSGKTKFMNKTYNVYRFSILSKGLGFYYNEIGFTHEKKSMLLKNWLERKNRTWNRRSKMTTKLSILKSLKEKPQSTQELSTKLNITESNVRAHIKGSSSGTLSLEKMGFIRKIDLNKFQGGIWEITEKGLLYLENNLI